MCNTVLSFADLSPKMQQRLHIYKKTLNKWQPVINLIGSNTANDFWTRHILDSLQLLPLLSAQGAHQIMDIGSGGGFPGLVLAIASADIYVHLVESDNKKSIFLREIIRLTSIKNASVHNMRIEQCHFANIDIITARACAKLDILLVLSLPFISRATICLFHKGEKWYTEVLEAKKNWLFDYEAIPSVTNPKAVILKLSHIKRLVNEG